MTEKQMFDFLVAGGLPEHGAAVLLAHFQAESGLNPRNLQNSANKKLDMTDDEYTASVDSGVYQNFVHDSVGYGYAQWTFWSRKQALLEFARTTGRSIGDPEMQLEFALNELQGYKTVLQVLKTEADLRTASDIVLEKYEQPDDQSEAEKVKRAGYAQEIYSRCAMKSDGPDAGMAEAQARQKLVDIAVSWKGKNEADGSHQEIIDIYNGHTPLARGYKVRYTDSWCATFASAAAIAAGYTDIIPTECGCGQMIADFQEMGRWIEDDSYIPSPGDYIFYDWNDTGTGDCTGWPEHVGIVILCDNVIKVIEGNKSDAVGYRELPVNGRYIRGYGVPDYGAKAVSKTPESVIKVPENVIKEPESGTESGKNVSEPAKTGTLCREPQWIGRVTGADIDVRRWAGYGYESIKSWPKLTDRSLVDVCDSIRAADNSTWYYIRINGRIYGFVCADHIDQAVFISLS